MKSASDNLVVFDWNGTLLDDTHIVLDCFNLALKSFSIAPVTMETFLEIQCPCMESLYRSAGVPEEQLEEAIDLERDIFHDNYERQSHTASLRAGVKDLLKKLKKHNVTNIILSNHIQGEISRLLKNHDIFHYFDDVLAFISRETQFRDKNKKERLLSYIQGKTLTASNALMVGDSTEEINVAHELGMTSVAVTGGMTSEKRLRNANPDYLIHTLVELEPILGKWGFIL